MAVFIVKPVFSSGAVRTCAPVRVVRVALVDVAGEVKFLRGREGGYASQEHQKR